MDVTLYPGSVSVEVDSDILLILAMFPWQELNGGSDLRRHKGDLEASTHCTMSTMNASSE